MRPCLAQGILVAAGEPFNPLEKVSNLLNLCKMKRLSFKSISVLSHSFARGRQTTAASEGRDFRYWGGKGSLSVRLFPLFHVEIVRIRIKDHLG